MMWEDLEKELKGLNDTVKNDLEEMELLAEIISSIIDKRRELKLSQKKLAEMCGIPQSTIGRMESATVIPNLETIIKILGPLGLKLKVVPIQ